MDSALLKMALAERTKFSLYLVLWRLLGERPGEIKSVSYAEIATFCSSVGLDFSETQVRNRLRELKKQGSIATTKLRARGRYDVLVYAPIPKPAPDKKEPEPEPKKDDQSLFEFYFKNCGEFRRENDGETEQEPQTFKKRLVANVFEPSENDEKSSLIKNNINNKQINKPTNEGVEKESDEKPSTADVRKFVDFENAKAQALRAEVVKRVWAPSVNPELVDRITALVVLKIGGSTWASVQNLLKLAAEESEKTRRASFREYQPVWRFATLPVKRLYEASGWIWTKTSIGVEPNPQNATSRNVEERPQLQTKLSESDIAQGVKHCAAIFRSRGYNSAAASSLATTVVNRYKNQLELV